MIDLPRGERQTNLAKQVDVFIRHVVTPCEGDPRIGQHGLSDALSYELKEKARPAGYSLPCVRLTPESHQGC